VPEHHPTPVRVSRGPVLEEKPLAGHHPSLEYYAAALKQRGRGRGVRALRRLLELKRTYPSGPFPPPSNKLCSSACSILDASRSSFSNE
jgi:hypothetical protein